MKVKNILAGAAVFGAIALSNLALAEGGVGPLLDVTDKLELLVDQQHTPNGVYDFTYWQPTRIFFRDSSYHNMWDLSIGKSPHNLGYSGRPLSRVTDPNHRFIATDDAPYVFDTETGDWTSYDLPSGAKHVFWTDKHLYSLVMSTDPDTQEQVFSVYRYSPDRDKLEHVCRNRYTDPNEHYRLATGHKFPYIYLYRQKRKSLSPEVWTLSLYKMNVKEPLITNFCGIEDHKIDADVVATVDAVHVFPDIESFAAEVEHPVKNFYWNSPGLPNEEKFIYYNLGGKPSFPNRLKPIAMLWNEEDGITFVDMVAAEKARLNHAIQNVSHWPVSRLDNADSFLDDDGKTMIMAPFFADFDTKFLFKMVINRNP